MKSSRQARKTRVGTLCHFDMVPQALSDEEFEMLLLAARLLPAYVLPAGVQAALHAEEAG